MLRIRHIGLFFVVAATLLAASCSSSSTASTSPTPSAVPQNSPAGTPKSTATPSAVATSLDPCQLVTSQEASSLTGVTYGAGTAETYTGGGKGCVYGSQTLNVFHVEVAQAADAATAQAEWAQEEAQAQSVLAQAASAAGLNLNLNANDVSNVSGADRAAVATGSYPVSGRTFNVSVIYVIKGAVFFTFSDIAVDVAAPSASAMEAQATTAVGRLP